MENLKPIFNWLFGFGLFLLLLQLKEGLQIVKESLWGVGDYILTALYFTAVTLISTISYLQEKKYAR